MITLDNLIELYKNDYPSDYESIVDGISKKRKPSFRLNRLKSTKEEIDEFLKLNNISYTNPTFFSDAYQLNEFVNMMDFDIVKDGKIYLQSLSSQIPPLFLEYEDNIDILDMCAAPGGKTCQIASMTNNMKNIMAVEANKIRADRLKYNLNLQGVTRANVFVKDSKKLDSFFRFDTILLDAPCSGSGTINLNNPRDLQSFSVELVKNSSKTQKELLKKAIEILKPGHTMVYSTCSILKVENEEVVKSVLGPNVSIVPIKLDVDSTLLLPSSIEGVITVKPSDKFEGFFIAKIKKNK